MIERATTADGRSVRALAAKAGISDTRWRHIAKGWQPAPGGGRVAVRAPAGTLARIAYVLALTAEDLEASGRPDAIAELNRLHDGTALLSAQPGGSLPAGSPATFEGSRAMPDEIEMIMASKSMSPREKLFAIRAVLRLRAEVDAEVEQNPEPGIREHENGESSTSSA